MSTGFNYFNYFTEIEEYFWRKRGAQMLVSPLDWAILESWQKAGIPLEAVLKGIDSAFESYSRSKRGAGGRPLKSLAYCVDAVLEAAAQAKEASVGAGPRPAAARSEETFSRDDLRDYLTKMCNRLKLGGGKLPASGAPLAGQVADIAERVAGCLALLDSPAALDLEDLERRLTVLEDKLYAALTAAAQEQITLDIRREMDRALSAYRRRMSAEHLAMLEQQYLRRSLFEKYSLPRLSLFYFT